MHFYRAAILVFSIFTGGLVAEAQTGPPAIRLERAGNFAQLMPETVLRRASATPINRKMSSYVWS
jgi:hypothetical protein